MPWSAGYSQRSETYIDEVMNHRNAAYAKPVRWAEAPALLAVELGNELRCAGCDPAVLTGWADEMSTHLRRHDPGRQFLISVGDEGFYCGGDPSEYTEQCGEGVDSLALSKLPAVDVVSAHLYPEQWGHRADAISWGRRWIARHIAEARSVGKPFVLGEYGLADRSARNAAYQEWTSTMETEGGAGDLVWMIAGSPAPDPGSDPFWLRCPDRANAHGDREVCATLLGHAQGMAATTTSTTARTNP